ncbi:pyridoxal phosphate-dependent aminotransferase [Staphylococcus carnosus]|uniref:Putative pyridoxal phosphate-dependent acyltransferase n=2 Tax=Staphylococcus carnosus TaxID=1281 RepID=B9DQ87_STACT|nr:histidinol-phosphate transaminase [Staphylococcus carnosus]ANZ33762.1 histidinol-phosphate aminotransferase [Staphylococcus carnosus]KKB24870.1 histidinol-phosphate aminotransferase [Staphylococcus carnosus]KOR14000.1 histidinol-phosphate aminotransferase [Staphylococcus carnosus]POA01849.1 histidinol-phosphate aminotransferase [Staphylococcus carnosus]QPT03717.1 histidinol-phosphate aminotransferase family protein [Staphylococcus carnosus]
MININQNESPIPALTQEEILKIVGSSDFKVYPEGQYNDFLQAYADYYNLNVNQVLAANGSDEWIQKCMLTLPKGPVLALNPDFVMYTEFAQQTDRPIEYVESDENFRFSLDTILSRIEEVQPAFFIMSVPHNPTGVQYPTEFLLAISDKLKSIGSYFVLDEAYIEFGKTIDIPLQSHLIIMKTLSKAFALAGLRIGIVISTPETIQQLNRLAHPYPMSTLSLRLAEALFKDQKRVKQLIAEQRFLCRKLQDIFNQYVADKITIIPSQANFVFTYGKHARELGEYVKAHGFLPRIYKEPLLSEAVRYSIATEQELDQLEAIVKEWSDQFELQKTT